MAKARRIPGLDADDPYATAAAKIIGVRVGEVIDHARGVQDVGDIERVHDMRVATRRLRAALEIFEPCFPRAELKAGLRQVKALADALGERRDRDVAIAALEDTATCLAAPDRPGVVTLITRLREEQAAANEALARLVTPEHLTSLGEQLSDLVSGVQPASTGDGAAPIEAAELRRRESAPDTAVRVHAVGEEA
jgi:CHAD domain-containing protein